MRNAFSVRLAFPAALLASLFMGGRADAVVLATDDFEAEGGGTGFASADNWGNLDGGVSDTSVQNPAFRALSPTISPFSFDSIFIAFDFNGVSATSWGGLSLFAGVDGGEEEVFIGSPGGFDYGVNTQGAGFISTGILVDDQVRQLITEVEFGQTGDTYRFWIDSFNRDEPVGELVTTQFAIDQIWQSVRVASDVGAGQFVQVDNLVIATEPEDVGLITTDATMTIDRGTGEIAFSTLSGTLENVVSYTLGSGAGALDATGWTPVDGRLDSPDGDGTFDADDDWLAAVGSEFSLSEQVVSETPGDGGSVTTTGISLGGAWSPSPLEDVTATVIVNDGGELRPLAIEVAYTGAAIVSGDLDGDGDIDADDWAMFKLGQGVVNGGMTALEAYRLGDLDGNFDHNFFDFDLFADAFDLANGTGSFQALLQGVPEPSSAAVLIFAIGFSAFGRRRGEFVR